jgi:hypothetical protein
VCGYIATALCQLIQKLSRGKSSLINGTSLLLSGGTSLAQLDHVIRGFVLIRSGASSDTRHHLKTHPEDRRTSSSGVPARRAMANEGPREFAGGALDLRSARARTRIDCCDRRRS